MADKRKNPLDDDVRTGETVSAILRNVETGEKRVIESAKYKIEVTVTDLRTGEVHKYEAKR